MSKHYIYMNGSVGCLPDTCEVFASKKAAIEFAKGLFCDSIELYEEFDMLSDLKEYGIFYFADPPEAGADYVSIEPCECGSIPETWSLPMKLLSTLLLMAGFWLLISGILMLIWEY